MRRAGFTPAYEDPAQLAATLERTDERLGALLKSEAFRGLADGAGSVRCSSRACSWARSPWCRGRLPSPHLRSAAARATARPGAQPVPAGAAWRFAEVLIWIALYIAFAETLGFIVTAGALLLAYLLRLGTRLRDRGAADAAARADRVSPLRRGSPGPAAARASSAGDMTDMLWQAFAQVLDPTVLAVIAAAAVYGTVFGSIPGLSATMAVALIVPLTYFLSPLAALAAVVTLEACAISAGDIPSALVRIPGTPASAAYADDLYQLAQRGQYHRALGVCITLQRHRRALRCRGARPVRAAVCRHRHVVHRRGVLLAVRAGARLCGRRLARLGTQGRLRAAARAAVARLSA